MTRGVSSLKPEGSSEIYRVSVVLASVMETGISGVSDGRQPCDLRNSQGVTINSIRNLEAVSNDLCYVKVMPIVQFIRFF